MELTQPASAEFTIPPIVFEQFYPILIVAGVVGVLYCFLGYKIVKFVLALTGFGLFATLAGLAVNALFPGSSVPLLIAWVIAGLFGAWLALFLFKAGVFFLGAFGGWVAAYQLLAERPEPWVPWAILGIGLVAAVLALVLERPILILSTAAIGAWMLTSVGLLAWLGPDFEAKLEAGALDNTQAWIVLVSWVLLALMGAGQQWRMTRPKRLAPFSPPPGRR